MKHILRTVSIVIVLGALGWSPGQAGGYHCALYGSAVNDNGASVTLEMCTEETTVKWRVTNLTDQTLHDVDLADKTYCLSNGFNKREIRKPGKRLGKSIGPGETGGTSADFLDILDTMGVDDGAINSARLKAPEVTFKVEGYPQRMSWNEVGQVRLDVVSSHQCN